MFSHPNTTSVQLNTNRDRAEIPQYLHIRRILAPNFEVTEQNTNDYLDSTVMSIKIPSEEEIEFIEKP